MSAFSFAEPFDSSLEGTPSPAIKNPNSKHAGYDTAALESLAPTQDASSPQGAASQGALENPASAGGNQPAIDEEPAQDMLSIFNSASPEDREHLTQQQTEALAPHGKSLEGGFLDVLKQGGPQAMARASQFGIDMTEFANKLNPADGEGPEAALGQAMGTVPSDEQAGQPAFKTKGKAVRDNRKATAKSAKDAAAKKKAQRDAIAAFLMETGLRIMGSQRDDLGGALGESALGTMESGRNRKRQAAADKMASEDRARKQSREDTADESAKLREAREIEQAEYDKTQREAVEAKTRRTGMQSVTAENGEVYYFDPLEPKAGEYVEDADGKRIKAADVGLSKAQIATTVRQRNSAINSKVEKIKAMDEFERVELYPETDGLKGNALREKIIELAQSELDAQGGVSSAENDPLGLL